MRLPELLAPAGSAVALRAAVRAGADAVYLGLGAFNARRNADNFTAETLREACDYAHLRGVKIYVAMNTIVLPSEMDEALCCAVDAYNAGADAFIVQDLGLLAAIQREIPQARLHASTQMNIHSAYGIQAAAKLGISRVTLARELSIGEIAHLANVASELGVQVEVFAHGALCVCYSGQCFMSSMIGGRSANRGLCAQACRLNYELEREGAALDAPGEYLLSPKDLCSAGVLGELAGAGVASLKIEGRMKSPEYVQSVVSVYRRVLDRLAASDDSITAEDQDKLASVFSRGFTTAYLEGQRGNDIMSYQRPNNRGQFIGRVKWVRDGKVGIACDHQLELGDVIEFWTKRGHSAVTIDENANCSLSFAEVSIDDKFKVHESDRVFRVQSAAAAFKDDIHKPSIPVVGSVRLELGKPLRAVFRVAEPDEINGNLSAANVGKSNAASSNMAALSDDINLRKCISQRLRHSFEEGFQSNLSGEAKSAEVEPARTKDVTASEVEEHVGRLGSTPFYLERLDIRLDEGVGIGFSQLHRIRAHALKNLQENILAPYSMRGIHKSKKPSASAESQLRKKRANVGVHAVTSAATNSTDVAIVALATNPACARAAKRAGASHIYVPALNYKRSLAEVGGCATYDAGQTPYPKHCTLVMPVVSHDAQGLSREAKTGIDAWENITAENNLLVQGIGDIERAAQIGAHFEVASHLPLVNHFAVDVAAAFGAQRIWLSPELNLAQIESLAQRSAVPLGIKIFGAQELMITEHCLLSSKGPCNEDCTTCARRTIPHFLKDRKGYKFPVTSDALGRGHIYNSVKLDATLELSQLIEVGVTHFMVDTTLMNPEDCAQAVGYCVRAMQDAFGGIKAQKRMANSTSGHLHRGVL